MRRWETYLSLLAVVLASASAVSIAGRARPLLAIGAIGILLLVVYTRLRRQLTAKRKSAVTPDAYERALRIQEDRERRFGR